MGQIITTQNISIMVLFFSIMDLQETIIEHHDSIYGFPSIYLCSSILAIMDLHNPIDRFL